MGTCSKRSVNQFNMEAAMKFLHVKYKAINKNTRNKSGFNISALSAHKKEGSIKPDLFTISYQLCLVSATSCSILYLYFYHFVEHLLLHTLNPLSLIAQALYKTGLQTFAAGCLCKNSH